VPIYLGTATPSNYKLGSNAVSKIYLGSTQVWPVASGALLTIARDNGVSTFTGSGTTASPFVRSTGIYLDAADGLSHYSWTAGATATVNVSFDYSDDSDNTESCLILRTRSGTTATIHSEIASVSGKTVSVIAGDVIRITASGDASYQKFSNVSVSAA